MVTFRWLGYCTYSQSLESTMPQNFNIPCSAYLDSFMGVKCDANEWINHEIRFMEFLDGLEAIDGFPERLVAEPEVW